MTVVTYIVTYFKVLQNYLQCFVYYNICTKNMDTDLYVHIYETK